MQLKYTKTTRKQVITIELETVNFTADENIMLEEMGEPIIDFQQNYSGKFPVSINRKIKTGFKVRVKFDGTDDINGASDAAALFLYDIQQLLTDTMINLKEKHDDADIQEESNVIDIKY